MLEKKFKKLEKQSGNWKEELEKVSAETNAASKSPWEDPELEDLTAVEKYEMLKNELVPAQQARLSKLCISELEKQLEETKNLLTKALIEKEAVRDALKKLETKVHFLSNPKVEVPVKPSKGTKATVQPKRTAERVERPEPVTTRRRSTRSASSLANYKITEALSPTLESPKKRKAVRDLNEPIAEKRAHKETAPAASLEERGALGCLTNSPAKSSVVGRR